MLVNFPCRKQAVTVRDMVKPQHVTMITFYYEPPKI